MNNIKTFLTWFWFVITQGNKYTIEVKKVKAKTTKKVVKKGKK